MQKRGLEAVFLMVGMIVGAGIFAVPYVFSRSGVLFGSLMLLVVAAVLLATHLMYADIIIATNGRHRLIGNVEEAMGQNAARASSVLIVLGNIASLLVYMVLGGTFLHALFGGLINLTTPAFQIMFLLLGALSLSFGARLVAKLNSVLIVALIALFAFLTLLCAKNLYVPNVMFVDGAQAFLPYGVVIFSLIGINAIPEMYALLSTGNASKVSTRANQNPGAGIQLKSAVRKGTFIAAALTLAFGIAVVGFNGPFTTQDAISGIALQLGSWVLVLGGMLGLLAIFTSFIILALNLDETFRLDFNLSKQNALLAAFAPVLIIFLLGARDLVRIISFTGTLLSGAMCIIVALVYLAMLKNKTAAAKFGFGRAVPLACIVFIALGMFAQLL